MVITRKHNSTASTKDYIAWRKKQGLTPEDISRTTGISYHTVVKWDIQGRKPRKVSLIVLASHFADCPLLK